MDEVKSGKDRKRKRERDETIRDIVKVCVPSKKMGYIAGTRFANVDRLEKDYDVRVVNLPQKGGKVIEIKGQVDQVANNIFNTAIP